MQCWHLEDAIRKIRICYLSRIHVHIKSHSQTITVPYTTYKLLLLVNIVALVTRHIVRYGVDSMHFTPIIIVRIYKVLKEERLMQVLRMGSICCLPCAYMIPCMSVKHASTIGRLRYIECLMLEYVSS